MYHIKNRYIDLEVTANHRMFVSKFDEKYQWAEYDFEIAEKLLGKKVKYKKDCSLDCTRLPILITFYN